jgi:hypothetical protein
MSECFISFCCAAIAVGSIQVLLTNRHRRRLVPESANAVTLLYRVVAAILSRGLAGLLDSTGVLQHGARQIFANNCTKENQKKAKVRWMSAATSSLRREMP